MARRNIYSIRVFCIYLLSVNFYFTFSLPFVRRCLVPDLNVPVVSRETSLTKNMITNLSREGSVG